ncbi:MAG: type II toxin-antitoxin system RelE/ParE family toxin [Bacteroidales bacterium]|nr:type II toxin-antitoxin system RelE/ParE family toxin [Bacteroidales bacterium]
MDRFILSKRARKDLLDIGDYTVDKWSEQQAETYVRMLLEECSTLSLKPLLGRSYDLYRPGLRGYPCGRHVIFYRILSRDKVRIVRILHERMDFPRHL